MVAGQVGGILQVGVIGRGGWAGWYGIGETAARVKLAAHFLARGS